MSRYLLPVILLAACGEGGPAEQDTAALPVEAAGPPPFVIDSNNAANNTAEYYTEVSGNWTGSTNVAGYWNTGYWVSSALWQYDPANFWFYLNADSCLLVESWWTASGDRAPNVPYQSYNGAGANVGIRYINQRTNGARWNEIGRYIFTPGWNRVLISRWADLGTYVIADAVRLTPVTDCPGWCGPDADGDGIAQCNDQCDNDPSKTAPGACGCGVADTNTDGDAFADCQETCDTDPAKSAPGVCGCGVSDANTDGDALVDCQETCDTDPAKTAPGLCGCGVADTNTDGDALADCQETCDTDPAKTAPGQCGCGVPDTDSDGDGAADCVESCDLDPDKTTPGVCGCGVVDEDLDGDGTPDCTICGDGMVEAPEICDDGNRNLGDGCDDVCQWEELLFSISPGTAGIVNTLSASQAVPNRRVTFLASFRLGSTPIPGCPGVRAPLDNPMQLGQRTTGANGVASLAATIPANLAGRTYALVAVEPSSCRVSEVWFETF